MTDARIDEADKEHTLWPRVKLSIHALDKTPSVDPVKIADHAFPKLAERLDAPGDDQTFPCPACGATIPKIYYTPKLIAYAANLTLRQIAREILRHLHKKNGRGAAASHSEPHRASEEAPTFPGDDFNLLQLRYPKAHINGQPQGYVVRDAMTETDWRWNVAHLFHDGSVTIAHGNQLKLWGERIKGFRTREAGVA